MAHQKEALNIPSVSQLKDIAENEALALNHQFVRVEHILLAIVSSPKTREKLVSFVGYGEYGDLEGAGQRPLPLSPLTDYVLNFAERIAEEKSENFEVKHVLQSIAINTNLRQRLKKRL